jgi:hypothetical protein
MYIFPTFWHIVPRKIWQTWFAETAGLTQKDIFFHLAATTDLTKCLRRRLTTEKDVFF